MVHVKFVSSPSFNSMLLGVIVGKSRSTAERQHSQTMLDCHNYATSAVMGAAVNTMHENASYSTLCCHAGLSIHPMIDNIPVGTKTTDVELVLLPASAVQI